jgi:hypothetical protein
MQNSSALLFAGLAVVALSGCVVSDRGDRYGDGYDRTYDGYYDGYYGAYNSGYWGNDGYFYYADQQHNYHRDDARHFHHESFDGGKPVRGEHHSDNNSGGSHDHGDTAHDGH